MKVKIQQFLFSKNHSWSNVGKAIGRELLKNGHEVHFISTDGIKEEFVDLDLKNNIKNFNRDFFLLDHELVNLYK